ncbi:MAG: InlB B-repeat-containing protein, partial [Clostridia bacterium]|nr:InlB B-repeat-containing protein [Clostridia bacterium]
FAIKRPFLKFVILDIVQYIMYALAFVMSCVIVGSLNTSVTSTGSAGACLLSFILIGAFFVVGGILLFKFGFMSEVVDEQKIAAAKWKEDRAAHKQAAAAAATAATAATATAETAALAAATVDSSSEEGETSSGGAEQKVITIVQQTGDDYDAQVFTKEKVPSKVKSYRYAPSIIALLYTAAVLILMSLPIATWVEGKGGSLITAIKVFFGKEIGVARLDGILMLVVGLLLMFFALLSVLRLLKAMGKPYYKMPILSIFQAVALYAILGISSAVMSLGMVEDDIASLGNAIACMVILIVTGMYVFFGAITALCANTDENRFYIKKARKEAFESKRVKGWQKAVTSLVLLAVFALTFGLQFITIGEPGFNKNSAKNIELGVTTRYELENVLSDGEELYSTVAYYSKSYRDFMEKVEKAENSWDFAEMEKLEKEFAKLEFKYYVIEYDSSNYVNSFIYNNKASGDEEKALFKKIKSASLTSSTVEWGYLLDNNYYDNNYHNGYSRPAVVVEYTDGSIEKEWLDINRFNITDLNISRYGTSTCKYSYNPAFTEEPVEFSINLVNVTNCYEVRFNLNGGDGIAPETQLITEFDTLIRPEDPVRQGYVFKGWYTEYGYPFNFYSDINSDMTLYAQWERAYRVSFSLNGVPAGTAPSAQYVYSGHYLVRPEDPSASGYIFLGWYDNSECYGNPYNFSYNNPTSDMTLYAKWERTYSVSFNLNGAPGTSPVTQNIYSGNPLRQPVEPVYDGY